MWLYLSCPEDVVIMTSLIEFFFFFFFRSFSSPIYFMWRRMISCLICSVFYVVYPYINGATTVLKKLYFWFARLLEAIQFCGEEPKPAVPTNVPARKGRLLCMCVYIWQSVWSVVWSCGHVRSLDESWTINGEPAADPAGVRAKLYRCDRSDRQIGSWAKRKGRK